MNELPEFRKMKHAVVTTYIHRILSGASGTTFLKLIEFEDHHYRVVFKSNYFALQGDAADATKSQWNTLKKKMKRQDKSVFIFKEHGKIKCEDVLDNSTAERNYDCLYIDFGYLY